jgi:hypothetical protein
MDIPEVTSLAQAMQVAQERLAVLAKRREVLDIGIVGNPALQKGDLVSVDDPLIGITMSGRIDTLETDMSADQPYVGVAAVIPQDVTSTTRRRSATRRVDDGGIDENGTPDTSDPGPDDGENTGLQLRTASLSLGDVRVDWPTTAESDVGYTDLGGNDFAASLALSVTL